MSRPDHFPQSPEPIPAPQLPEPRRPLLRRATAVVIAALSLAGCTSHGKGHPQLSGGEWVSGSPEGGIAQPPVHHAGGQELLASGQWNYLLNGHRNPDKTLTISRSGQAVITNDQDGRLPGKPNYQPNPPVNLYGTHVAMDQPGNVGVWARLTNLRGASTFSVLSRPNTRRDESIEHHDGVDVTVDGNKATISVWHDRDTKPQLYKLGLPKAATTADITVEQADGTLSVDVNGAKISMAQDALSAKTAWFGADAATSFTLAGLNAYPLHGNTVKAVDASQAFAGLKTGHKGDKYLGTAIDLPTVVANPRLTEFIIRNMDELEPENLAKWQAIHPEKDTYAFGELDALVAFAEAHGMQVHGHALAFMEANPKWLLDELSHASRPQAEQLLRDHIRTVVSRYDGQHGHGTINAWDVVNEYFDPDEWDQPNQDNPWYKALGKDYVRIAFDEAHKANPNAKLFLNDWGAETDDDRWTGVSDLLDELRQAGVPVDGFGFQMHLDETTLKDSGAMNAIFGSKLPSRLAWLKAHGLLARFSELSIAENGNVDMQTRVAKRLGQVCAAAPNCVGINLWGAANTEVDYSYFTGNGSDQDPGDDAPLTQSADGRVGQKGAWPALKKGIGAS